MVGKIAKVTKVKIGKNEGKWGDKGENGVKCGKLWKMGETWDNS